MEIDKNYVNLDNLLNIIDKHINIFFTNWGTYVNKTITRKDHEFKKPSKSFFNKLHSSSLKHLPPRLIIPNRKSSLYKTPFLKTLFSKSPKTPNIPDTPLKTRSSISSISTIYKEHKENDYEDEDEKDEIDFDKYIYSKKESFQDINQYIQEFNIYNKIQNFNDDRMQLYYYYNLLITQVIYTFIQNVKKRDTHLYYSTELDHLTEIFEKIEHINKMNK